MVGADGEVVRRRRPRLDLLVQAMGEDPGEGDAGCEW